MSTKDITLANFNCTFRVGDSIFPMLQYFSELILPAVRTKDYVRRGKDTEHSLTDVEVVNLTPTSETPNFALVGRHVKRVRLLIKHDYNISSGFIPKDERHWSAPYSTFVLLLKNHRLIHFQDQNGSPALGSLRTTINSSIREFRKKAIKEAYDDIRALGPESRYFELVRDVAPNQYRKDLSAVVYPLPEINIVPIPAPNRIDEMMKTVKKINRVSFRVYPLNSELDMDPFFSSLRTATEDFETNSGQAVFNGPKNIPNVGKALKNSKGLADFTVEAETTAQRLTLKPDEFVESIKAEVPDEASVEEQSQAAYDHVREREDLNEVSDENYSNYIKFISAMSTYWG